MMQVLIKYLISIFLGVYMRKLFKYLLLSAQHTVITLRVARVFIKCDVQLFS